MLEFILLNENQRKEERMMRTVGAAMMNMMEMRMCCMCCRCRAHFSNMLSD